jgi:pyrimidine-specific ribonucleoside hydrolase
MLALMVLAGTGNAPSAVIGTAGNVDADVAYRNAAGIAALLGFECPVAKGTHQSLIGPYPDTGDPFHGVDGLGGISSDLPSIPGSDAPSDPIPLLQGAVLATGPLTVIAHALAAGRPITEIVWMGGAVACGGNMSASAEFNAWLDPEACDRVLSSGVPLAMVPLDVTHQVSFDGKELAAMGALGKMAALASQSCAYICDRDSLVFPHDAVAVIAQLHPDLFGWEDRWVRCELSGGWTRGMTVVDRRHRGESGSVRVAMDVNTPAVKEILFEALRSLG